MRWHHSSPPNGWLPSHNCRHKRDLIGHLHLAKPRQVDVATISMHSNHNGHVLLADTEDFQHAVLYCVNLRQKSRQKEPDLLQDIRLCSRDPTSESYTRWS